MQRETATLATLLVTAIVLAPRLDAQSAGQLAVTVNTDQADATLAIATMVARGAVPDSAAWRRLFESKGYIRLKERETGMGRSFTDSAFREFALSRDLARRVPELRSALDGWRSLDASAAARKALAYLPDSSRLRAEVFPVVKPQTNSFVWDLGGDPAIFFYLDPSQSPAKAQNTMAHELHHVGFASACAGRRGTASSTNANSALQWTTGFGEGLAMLAAAGGYDVHPHAQSDSSERAIWERDVARWKSDFEKIQGFLLAVAQGRAGSSSDISRRGMAFVNTDDVPQGPFYTVGWSMGSLVERELGKAALIDAMCNGAELMRAYNRAADRAAGRGETLPRWSEEILGLIG